MARPLLEGTLLFPSNYICAEDLKGKDAKVTIESVGVDDLPIAGTKVKKKSFLIGFKGKTKKLVCNKTNAVMIADQHGQEAKGWVGKSITIFPTECMCKGKMVPCIRVREVVRGDEPLPVQANNLGPIEGDDILAGTTPNRSGA